MSQATLPDRPYVNSNLFTGHYLDNRVRDRDDWDCDEAARAAMEELQALHEREGSIVEGFNESELIDNWIDEVLEVLGFGTKEEVTLPDGAGHVDKSLFEDESTRRDAAELYLQTESMADVFERGIGILEAKQWDADFTAEFSEHRQYRNASHQIKHYLEKTPSAIQWGILTNGRKWRLYGTKDYETQTYYEVDLPELLESGDLERFKYFFVFFRPAAFRESGGTTFLDEVRSESETAAQQLGDDLQDNVFTALRVLGRGFVETNDLAIDPDDEAALEELKEQSLVMLYRLMFVLYAEAQGLIHPDDADAQSDYEKNFSLDALRLRIHEEIGEVDTGFEAAYNEHSTRMWNRLADLFQLIDEGQADLGIPPYNGGLFDHDQHDFLTEHTVSDRYLAEVIYRLSTTENDAGRYVLADYADLDTRHLGSVYEGLLEHHFRIAPEQYAAVAADGGQVWEPASEVTVADAVETVPQGGLYVVNDEGERKATGAYYTPDYVVTYIVEETVGPLVEEIHDDLESQGYERGTQAYVSPFIRRVTDLEILDPAMGSGHFLTRATEYLANEVMAELRDVETEMGVAIDEQQMRRDIAKECIYGVDINGMAVELAKLSMWLETLATDRPLAFLDHHFKLGNSLVGSDIEDIKELESDANGDDEQSSLAEFGATREGTIERLMDIYSEFVAIESETVEDVREMKRKYAEIEQDELRQRLVAMANVHSAEDFELDPPDGAYERMAKALENEEKWDNIAETDWFSTAQEIADNHSFFHWRLAFPEVFYREITESYEDIEKENPGFDVIIGNPPYLNAWSMTEKMPELRDALKRGYSDSGALEGHWDMYLSFVVRSLELTRDRGYHSFILPNTLLTEKYAKQLRKLILSKHKIKSILDFEEREVFPGVDRQCVVYVIEAHNSSSGDQQSLRTCVQQEPFEFREESRVSPNVWLNVYNFQIRVDKNYVENHLPLIEKVDNNSDWLGQYLYVNVGATVSSKESGGFTKSDVVSAEPIGNDKKFFEGTDLQRWHIDWQDQWLDYREDEMSGARQPEMFESDKIVVRKRTDEGGRLAGAFDSTSMYCDDTVIVCCEYEPLEDTGATTDFEGFDRLDEGLNMSFILSLINSTFMSWVFKYKFETGALQGSYSDVWPQSVRNFPIPCRDAISSEYREGVGYEEKMIQLRSDIEESKSEKASLNLNLADYLGSYDSGQSFSDLSPTPPEGFADSILNESENTTDEFETLRISGVEIQEEGDILTVFAIPYVKPVESVRDEYDTNNRGYATLNPEPAMVFQGLDKEMIALIRGFVPFAVANEEGGFADNATKTISLIDRLEDITLPKLEDVKEGLDRYREKVDRAEELTERIHEKEGTIDDMTYELYDLTNEEIEIVEEAVATD
ncbi:Eco57I restriction-modification methylase domain-containing protein [Halococcoides cellulosivorans]|uniref:site-specific DNA-methyltransferase (adenine-specific) n=1 Tax=Halococcoides cellulosivorans TaxID=1679096 RepID=A0A2R4X1V8_9EURY|nr:TaqI-like C-terminal specificity domain-containing protein [Halococcoides cellulosivorans]AWB27713.1 restriction endonuclease [Halococcoides cellulosivorans]